MTLSAQTALDFIFNGVCTIPIKKGPKGTLIAHIDWTPFKRKESPQLSSGELKFSTNHGKTKVVSVRMELKNGTKAVAET